MQYLRYNTDSQEVVFGIFVDSTDGNTEETGLTIANTDIKIWKAGATTLANKNSGGATHISNGIYYAVFDSTDTNTLGSGKAFIHVSGALYQVLEFCVLHQKVYDSMIAGSDNLEVEAVAVSDKTGYSLSTAGVSAVQSGLSTLTAADVWNYATRTLSSFGTLVSDVATAVWGATTRTLSAFGFTVAATVSDKTGYSLSSAGITSIQTGLAKTTDIAALNDISVADILSGETEAGLTLKHAMQIITALALKATGGGTSSISFRNYGDTKNRLTMTVDEDGNRTSVTISLD